MICNSYLGLIFVLFCALVGTGTCISVRGVPPNKASLYETPGGEFKCLDGSGSFPASVINDDYCDCIDGSDEPGTSACPRSSFYCPNVLHKPELLPASRVNDGLCDCCDGSDEWDGPKECPNTCDEAGLEARKEAARVAAVMVKARAVYESYSKEASDFLSEGAARIEQIKTQLEAMTGKLEQLRAAKDDAHKPFQAAREAHDQAWETEKKALTTRAHMWLFKKLDSDSNNVIEPNEVLGTPGVTAFDENKDGTVTLEEVRELFGGTGKDKEEQEEEGEHEAKEKDDRKEDDGQTKAEAGSGDDVTRTATCDYDRFVSDVYGDITNLFESDPEYVKPPTDDDKTEDPPELKALDSAYEAKLLDFDEANGEKNDLEKDLSELEKWQTTDAGPDKAFLVLRNECTDLETGEYKYSICPFKKAGQAPKAGGHQTSLGSWTGFKVVDGETHMLFENGEKCWNGPQRSVDVTVVCGDKNIVTQVAEPNRCAYVARMESPAVCGSVKIGEAVASPHDEL